MPKIVALLVALGLSLPAPAAANPLCRWLGLCLYGSPGFELTVVDAETGTPLAGVYAWAEWVQYGAHGVGGPLVVQDARSGADGRLAFPRWGPTRGSRAGLRPGADPAVVLFRSGYTTRVIDNGVAPGASHHAALRGSSHGGQAIALHPFRGSAERWVEQIHALAYPGLHAYVSNPHRDRFAAVYLRRAAIAVDELARLPRDTAGAATLRGGLERSVRFYRGDQP